MSFPMLLPAMKLALGVASGIGTAVSGVMQYKDGVEQAEQNAEASIDAYHLETYLTGQRGQQEQEAASQKVQDIQVKALQDGARAENAAAAGGVEGGAVQAVLADFKRNEGIITDRTKASAAARKNQLQVEQMGMQANAQNRINSVPPPSLGTAFGAIFRGAGGIASSVSDYADMWDGDYPD